MHRVLAQRRHVLVIRARERLLGVARIEGGDEIHVLEHLVGYPELTQSEPARLAQWRHAHQQRKGRRGDRVEHALVHAHREARSVGGGGEIVHHRVHPLRAGVGEVEGLPVQTGLVGDVVERARHPVDRHHVGLAEVEPHKRQPLRHHLAHALDRLEEVVGTVDLVHLAGLRVADDDPRAVHPPRHSWLLAHDPLGLELGGVVGGGEVLALVEAVLPEHPFVGARHGDRGDVVEVLRAKRGSQFDRVVGATDVHRHVELKRRGHVVHGGEVEEVLDVPFELSHLLLPESQERLAQVADDWVHALAHRPTGDGFPLLDQVVEASERVFAHEHMDLALAFEQSFDQPAADEARRARYEIRHVGISSRSIRRG